MKQMIDADNVCRLQIDIPEDLRFCEIVTRQIDETVNSYVATDHAIGDKTDAAVIGERITAGHQFRGTIKVT